MVTIVDNSTDNPDFHNVTVNLTILNSDGLPIPGVLVELEDRGGSPDDRSGRTDSDGKIKFIENTGPSPPNHQTIKVPSHGITRDLGWNNSATFDLEFELDIDLSLDITDFVIPNNLCIGSTFNSQVVVQNTSPIPGTGRVVFTTSSGEQSVTDTTTISSGENASLSESLTAGSPNEGVTAEVQYNDGDEWVTVDRVNGTIDTDEPEFTIEQITVPDAAQPTDDFTVSFTVANQEPCDGEARVQATGMDEEQIVIAANNEKEYNYNIEMRGEELNFNIVVENLSTQAPDSKFTTSVAIEKAVEINTAEANSLFFYGGFSKDINYTSILVGSGFTGESLEEEDSIKGDNVAIVRGTLTGNELDIDRYGFESIQYGSMRLDIALPFIKNGEVQGTSDTIQFNNTRLPVSIFNTDGTEHELTTSFTLTNPDDIKGRLKSFNPNTVINFMQSER